MLAFLFGSYSIEATFPVTPILFLLKSITRYFFLAPPPICLTVNFPWLFLPPVLPIVFTNDFSYEGYKREAEEGDTYSGVFSGLFVFIAILSVVTTMNRFVKKERTQIPFLREEK